jgi:C-terminal processing protease CtpA/Prc
MRDTLGLLVSSVTAGGPADKAGIEEGNRIVSINGVSLKLSASDAGEGDMDGIVQRRLVRELEKVKAGDEVDLRIWAAGQAKAVKVKTIAMEDLPSRTRNVRREIEDRPVLGMTLSSTGSKRDTSGMMVVRVTTDGPAEKAGIIEGDRISSINGVSLKVAAEDAGDGYMSSARMNRYRREISKVAVGEEVELRVATPGQAAKTVKVKPVRAGDLPRERGGVMIIGDGAVGVGDIFPSLPSITIPPGAIAAPRAPSSACPPVRSRSTSGT